jgi:hypothetical protein
MSRPATRHTRVIIGQAVIDGGLEVSSVREWYGFCSTDEQDDDEKYSNHHHVSVT